MMHSTIIGIVMLVIALAACIFVWWLEQDK